MKLNTKLIRQEQLKRGLTQNDLAEVTGLNQVTIGNIYKRQTAQMRSVKLISEALDIPLSKIWDFSDEEEETTDE